MLRKLMAAAALMSLAACATPYVATPYERAEHSVQSISMLEDSMPDDAIAYEVASLGSNLGLIGALVDAGIQASRREAVNEALGSISFDAETELEASVSAALSGKGYSLASVSGAEREKRELLEAYPDSNGADALLDVAIINYGYLSSGMGQPFRPTVTAHVRLIKASDQSTLMDNRIVYNPLLAEAGVIVLPPNADYAFKNREELLEDPARLAAGIQDALNQVAETTARLLQ